MKRFLHYFILLSTLLSVTTGCEVVRWKTKHDQSSLKKEGFSKQQMPLREGGNLTYWEGGQGQPLLLLHGFGGTAAATWKAEMIQLSKKYRVIAPDLLWFGESYSDDPAQLATQTNAIWQLVDTLKLTKIDVVGISYGGFITYDMMLTPERINKAVIIASPGPLFNDQDLSDLVQRAGIQSPEELFVPNNGDGVKRLYDNVFIDKKIIPDFIANQIYHDYFSQWKPQRTQLIKTLPNDRDRIHQYDPKKLPQALLIWGENDQIFPLKSGIQLSQYIQAPIIVLPKTAHGITNEKPTITADLIDNFLSIQ
ncbi:alpha/beta fold hydrolase [Photobacterium phosphoreum]|uniref:alpha/beta fold hydrolase n=1 Tax=Photobacterium phosphoreum TaxID=659 RepID=UPI000D16C1A2|nr:alpha/beta hydrolase [Photobacterium phosphoreum]PTB30935.1 alpha/beta hydrolase [Photobacterium phosphoreum]